MLTRKFTLPIKAHAIMFIALLAVLFAVVSTVTLSKVNQARNQIDDQHSQAARLEVMQAIKIVKQKMLEGSQKFIDWDETHQQVLDPSYYPYWRDIRVLKRGMLPETVNAIELYDAHGDAIDNSASVDMPTHVSGPVKLTVREHKNQTYGYLLQPIYDGYSKTQRSGYALIRFDFMRALHQAIPFHYVDPAHLNLALKEGKEVDVDALASHIDYQLQSNADLDLLFQVMVKAQYQIAVILMLLSLFLYSVLMRFVARPLQLLSQHIDTLKDHYEQSSLPALDQHLAIQELENVRNSLNDYQLQLNNMHHRIDEKNVELWGLAHRDPLTGAYNRRCFDEDWLSLSASITQLDGAVAFLLFDCDYFKTINDTYGHQVGDRVLIVVANAMQSCLRGSDRLYRIGGDEFAVMFVDLNPERCVEVAKRCIDAIGQYDFGLLGVKDPVRISVGIARTHELHPDRLQTLPKQADIAMYYAKQPGRNKLAIYTDEMEDLSKSVFSNQLTNAVFNAINTGEGITMHYQPIVNLATQKIEYYETLVRLRMGDDLVMPNVIFPIVAARHLETEFDFAIMRSILNDLKNHVVPVGTGISINLSGMSILHDALPEYMAQFRPYLYRYKLVLEVTETALITQIQQASSSLLELRRMGFVIALDDFGSGYSSLSYLASMPVDVVKFDLSMIRSLDQGGRHGDIIAGLASMINNADYALVAEGIETESTLNKVIQLGFSHAQGYLFGRPAVTPLIQPQFCKDV